LSQSQQQKIEEGPAWHALGAAEAASQLQTDPLRGLDDAEAQRRLEKYGANELTERGIKSPWAILWEQLTAFLVVILIVAAVISIALGEWKDSIAILTIVILNAAIGLSQEYRAEKAMAALKRLSVPTVRVRRNGRLLEISAKELVPGDVVLLEAGSAVPADGRLVEEVNLKTQEAALTGESESVEKDMAAVAPDAALADRTNMVYLGTAVTYGRGVMAVTSTGMETELGRIATMLQTVQRDPTPLQIKLNDLGRLLTYVAVAIIMVVATLQWFLGAHIKEIFMTAVSMAVAAVPEGLPAVVTISLALGAQRMLRRRVLIRKLTAVETLGSVSMICSDKTGTLTENKMTVVALAMPCGRLDLRGTEWVAELAERDDVLALLAGAALASDAELKDGDASVAIGDPTEGALVLAAAKAGLVKHDMEKTMPRVAEAPFDSDRKRMTTVHSVAGTAGGDAMGRFFNWAAGQGARVAFTKGSVDGLLQLSTHVWSRDKAEPMTDARRQELIDANNAIAGDGMRVLGLACRTVPADIPPVQQLEEGLTFIGMLCMIDPVRAEVPPAVRTCRTAGIRPMMITGDHPLTARAIARDLGMMDDDRLATGHDLEDASDSDLQRMVRETTVYARVSPEHKLRIVQSLQDQGHVVAMTGDGVNDAPALKKANIGVAMGITGTDVSKEASDMVLQDDNFATIVSAVEEGRIIYDNIRRFVRYILATNSGELWLMLFGPMLGMTLPLLPVQILWMNLVTDGLPALALAVEPAERDVMRRPPRRRDESIVGWAMGIHVIWVGLLMAIVTLAVGLWRWTPGDDVSWHHAQTMIFTIVVLLQLGHAMAIRSVRDSIFTQGLFSNAPLFAAVCVMVLLQIGVIYAPILQEFFGTAPLTPIEFGICAVAGSAVFWAVELEKFVLRRLSARSSL